MKFILTNREDGETFSATTECVIRVIGAYKLGRLMREVRETGKPNTSQFEGNYELTVKTDEQFLIEDLEEQAKGLRNQLIRLETKIKEEKIKLNFKKAMGGDFK